MKSVTIISGPAGSGKSYAARNMAEATGARIIEEFGAEFEESLILVIPSGVQVGLVKMGEEV